MTRLMRLAFSLVVGTCLLWQAHADVLLSEGFEATADGTPTPPTGWAVDLVAGGNYTSFRANGTWPTCTPYAGSRLVEFNSFSASSGYQNRLRNTTPFSTVGFTNVTVSFAWLVDPSYSSSADRVVVQYSTDGSTWNSVSTFNRYSPSMAWTVQDVPLPAGALNQASVQVAFLFISQYGNNCHLDDVLVTGLGGAQLSSHIGPFAGGNVVTITGTGSLGAITNVLIGGIAAAITGADADSVTIIVPAVGSAGLKDVVLQTGSGDTTLPEAYTVCALPDQLPLGTVVYDDTWTWNGTPLTWRIVHSNYTGLASSLTLSATRSLGTDAYYTGAWENRWVYSTLRTWLNGASFYGTFSAPFAAIVLPTQVPWLSVNNVGAEPSSGVTTDYVFLASRTELGGTALAGDGTVLDWFADPATAATRRTNVTLTTSQYWTRTAEHGWWSYAYFNLCAYNVQLPDGVINYGNWTGDGLDVVPVVNVSSDVQLAPMPDGTYRFALDTPQAILLFPNPGTQAAGALVPLQAIASSGLPVVFEVLSGPASLSGGSNLLVYAAGTVTVVATQSGSAFWAAATPVTNTFDVIQTDETVHFAVDCITVTEGPGSLVSGYVRIFVMRNCQATAAASVDYTTIDGSAVANIDYTPVSGTLSWGANDHTPQSFVVPIINSSYYRGTRTFQVQLRNPSNAYLVAPSICTVTILDDDAKPKIACAVAAQTVARSTGAARIRVRRLGSDFGTCSVTYATVNGTAAAGSDYTAVSGTLTWVNGDLADKWVDVPVSGSAHNGQTFTLRLLGVSGEATQGSPSSTKVTLTSKPATRGAVQFAGSAGSVAESAGTVRLTVRRVGGSAGKATVKYATANGTAKAGSDYRAKSGTLTWNDGDASDKTIIVLISADTAVEMPESFTVVLSSPSGTNLGSPSVSTVTITDTSIE